MRVHSSDTCQYKWATSTLCLDNSHWSEDGRAHNIIPCTHTFCRIPLHYEANIMEYKFSNRKHIGDCVDTYHCYNMSHWKVHRPGICVKNCFDLFHYEEVTPEIIVETQGDFINFQEPISFVKKSEPSFYDGYGFFSEFSAITAAHKSEEYYIEFFLHEKALYQAYPTREIRDEVFQLFLDMKMGKPLTMSEK